VTDIDPAEFAFVDAGGACTVPPGPAAEPKLTVTIGGGAASLANLFDLPKG
jgi:hypothetical protein